MNRPWFISCYNLRPSHCPTLLWILLGRLTHVITLVLLTLHRARTHSFHSNSLVSIKIIIIGYDNSVAVDRLAYKS